MNYMPSSRSSRSIISVEGQYFEGSVTGIRQYLETVKLHEPELYTRLDVKLAKMESEQTTGRILLALGLGVGTASTLYAMLGRTDCAMPSLTATDFASQMDAWGKCNTDNQNRSLLFGLVGVGAILTGTIAYMAVSPSRAELFDFVNEHNRLSRELMHVQLGYDPLHQVAWGKMAWAY